MIYPENDGLIEQIKTEILDSIEKDVTGQKAIAVLKRNKPFIKAPINLVQQINVIALHDRYLITIPEYDETIIPVELVPKSIDGANRLVFFIHQQEMWIKHKDCFDENIRDFFYRAHLINQKLVVLPRYHPDELTAHLFFDAKPAPLINQYVKRIAHNKIFFNVDTNKYDIGRFMAKMTINQESRFFNHLTIKGEVVEFIADRNPNRVDGDWIEDRAEEFWTQAVNGVFGFLNYNLPDDKLANFRLGRWAERIGCITRVAANDTCYLTYLLQRMGTIE